MPSGSFLRFVMVRWADRGTGDTIPCVAPVFPIARSVQAGSSILRACQIVAVRCAGAGRAGWLWKLPGRLFFYRWSGASLSAPVCVIEKSRCLLGMFGWMINPEMPYGSSACSSLVVNRRASRLKSCPSHPSNRTKTGASFAACQSAYGTNLPAH